MTISEQEKILQEEIEFIKYEYELEIQRLQTQIEVLEFDVDSYQREVAELQEQLAVGIKEV